MRVLCRRTNKEYTKYCLAYSLFQSPSSVWRTTPHCGYCGPLLRYFNPRPPCGGRLSPVRSIRTSPLFQSASSVWRTTSAAVTATGSTTYFNPRPPCGGRRRCGRCSGQAKNISIHVLRVENDAFRGRSTGRRLIFQSTSSVWRTTAVCLCIGHQVGISIHVLRVEDDVTDWVTVDTTTIFQSTSSVWRTTGKGGQNHRTAKISIPVLRVEDDPGQGR